MRRTSRVAVSLLSVAAISGSLSVTPGAAQGLQNLLAAEIAAFPGRAGVWVKHLTTGEEAGVNAEADFNSASVIKLPILALALEMAERGELTLSDRIEIRLQDVRRGSGMFRHLDSGLQPTLRDILAQMVITSDNTATDLALTAVGGVARVNDWIRAKGFSPGMELHQSTGELFAKYDALPTGSSSNERTNFDRGYWLGTMQPKATGRLLEAIEDGTLASSASRDEMLRMLRAQVAGARRLPHYLTVPVGHKTGDFSPVLANDVGIIYTRSGAVIVAFFGNEIVGPYGEAEDRIGRLAQLIVQYFDGAQ